MGRVGWERGKETFGLSALLLRGFLRESTIYNYYWHSLRREEKVPKAECKVGLESNKDGQLHHRVRSGLMGGGEGDTSSFWLCFPSVWLEHCHSVSNGDTEAPLWIINTLKLRCTHTHYSIFPQYILSLIWTSGLAKVCPSLGGQAGVSSQQAPLILCLSLLPPLSACTVAFLSLGLHSVFAWGHAGL